MMKKVLLIAGLVIAVVFLGDILYLLTKNAYIANWGDIIIPSFLVGIVAKHTIKNSELKNFALIAPAFLVATKIIMMMVKVNGLLVLSVILSIAVYYAVSWLFVFLGEKI